MNTPFSNHELRDEVRRAESSDKQLRIEALRAAVQVVTNRRWWERLTFNGESVSPGKCAVLLAEKYVKWLETGER